jgi:hypothetical protein
MTQIPSDNEQSNKLREILALAGKKTECRRASLAAQCAGIGLGAAYGPVRH